MSGQDGNSDQVSADDVKATGRLRLRPQPGPAKTLADVPPMDPALEAYRQAKGGGYPAPQPAPVVVNTLAPAPAQTPPPLPARNEGDALKKSSLVFVSGNSGASASVIRPASGTAEPALRSEEHTSELQSLRHLVCRLLLEKKT